jgi:hypothetical protein
VTRKRSIPLPASLALGAGLCLLAVSWAPLWRVERPTSKVAEIEPGSFWEFLGNLPSALEGLSVPQGPETVLSILPTVYLGHNAGATALVVACGAAYGFMASPRAWVMGSGRRPAEEGGEHE